VISTLVFGAVVPVTVTAPVADGEAGVGSGETVSGGAVVSTVKIRGVDGDSFHALSVLVTE
jgi:hypothetical protein